MPDMLFCECTTIALASADLTFEDLLLTRQMRSSVDAASLKANVVQRTYSLSRFLASFMSHMHMPHVADKRVHISERWC